MVAAASASTSSATIELDPVLPDGSQRLLFALDPTGNSLAAASTDTAQNAPVYVTTYEFAEAREFVLDTYQVCAAAQALSQTPEVLHDEDAALQHFARVGTLYTTKLLQHLSRLQTQMDALNGDEHPARGGGGGEDDHQQQASVEDRRARVLGKQEHWSTVYQIFALAQVLYLPTIPDAAASASEEPELPVVGEQLLHFINTIDPQPSREEGLQLASMSAPYSEPMFWSYLPRCIIRGLYKAASTLTASMADHPLPFVRHASGLICALLDRAPRPSFYSTSYEHLRATHTFRMDVQRAVTELMDQFQDVGRWTPIHSNNTGRSSSRQGAQVAGLEDRQDWLTRILLLLRLLKGEEDMVLSSCDDWKEALAAWAMLVRPTMTREDIPDTVKKIWETLPLDSELPGEEAQEALILGRASMALAKCNDISPWLSTHLGDLLDKIGALDSDGADARDAADASLTGASASTQRDWYLLRWADQLQGDEGVWRIALHYLAFVAASKNLALAEVAEGRMKAVLKHTKWRDPTVPYASASAKADVQMDSLANGEIENQHFEKGEPGQEQETTVEDVLKACYEYGFDDVATDLCKAASEKFIAVREYGRAVAFAVQAGDAQRIACITEMLIDEYILHGAGEFARLVDAFPTRLLRPDAPNNRSFFKSLAPADGGDMMEAEEDAEFGIEAAQLSLFQDRISFLARYRDVHAFFANEQKPEAAKTIIGLLRSGVVPKRFQAVLLLDALSLLEDEADIYFDQQDTFELMRYLELIETQSRIDKHLLTPLRTLLGQENWDRVAQALRLSLTKNLSRCFCIA